jgi:Flp pilus assembly protein TadG
MRLRGKRGSGGIDIAIVTLVIMMFIAMGVKVFPAFMVKSKLDSFATELVREAEISGRVAGETTARAAALRAQLGIDPSISWSQTGRIQLNTEVTVSLAAVYDIGFFSFGSWPVTLKSSATGKSEVYWK